MKGLFSIYKIETEANQKLGIPGGSVGKESACNAGDRRCRFDPWARKIPWRRKQLPTSAFLPGSPWTEEPGGPQFIR